MPCTWCIPNTTLPFYTISVCVQVSPPGHHVEGMIGKENSMRIDDSHYVKEILQNKNGAEFWQSANDRLAQRVYAQIKWKIPAAKLYVFNDIQIITTNPMQEAALLNFLSIMEDMCNAQINKIHKIRRRILGGDMDV